jgi:hypothetical protein
MIRGNPLFRGHQRQHRYLLFRRSSHGGYLLGRCFRYLTTLEIFFNKKNEGFSTNC